MFGWFRQRWVSRSEYDLMREVYEEQLAGMRELLKAASRRAPPDSVITLRVHHPVEQDQKPEKLH